jgi:hypothetical protein
MAKWPINEASGQSAAILNVLQFLVCHVIRRHTYVQILVLLNKFISHDHGIY